MANPVLRRYGRFVADNPREEPLHVTGRKRPAQKQIHNFKEKYPKAVEEKVGDSTLTGYRLGQEIIEVDFLVPAEDRYSDLTFYVAGQLLHSEIGSANSFQFCFYFLSQLNTMMPFIKEYAEESYKEVGVKLREVKIPTDAEDNMIILTNNYPKNRVITLVHLGCAILILFKNIHPRGYIPYMENRIRAMASKVGVTEDLEITNAFAIEVARRIRAGVGFSPGLKRIILEKFVLANMASDSRVGYLCNYLATILAWTEMHILSFIWTTLIITDSPIVRDPRVKDEVANLATALDTVSRSPYPQYFRFIGGTHRQYLIERSRFRILAGVATELMKTEMRSLSVTNFISTVSDGDQVLIERLIEEHRHYMALHGSRVINKSVRALMNYEGDESEDEGEQVPQQNQAVGHLRGQLGGGRI